MNTQEWEERNLKQMKDRLRKVVVDLRSLRDEGTINDSMTLPQVIEVLLKATR